MPESQPTVSCMSVGPSVGAGHEARAPDLFAIVSPPRCGSNYLRSLLGAHPEVACHNEIFHPDDTSLFLPHLSRNHQLFDTAQRDRAPAAFLDRMLLETRSYYTDARSIGFKVLLNHEQIAKGLTAVLDLRPRVICLTRRNHLAWYSSLLIATETDRWEQPDRPKVQHRVSFDEEQFRQWTDEMTRLAQEAVSKIVARRLPYLKLDYEDLLGEAATERVLQFLGLPYVNLTSNIVKQNSATVLERFVNPADVVTFAQTNHKTAWLEPEGIGTKSHIASLEQRQKEIENRYLDYSARLKQMSDISNDRTAEIGALSCQVEQRTCELAERQAVALNEIMSQLAAAHQRISSIEQSLAWRVIKRISRLGRTLTTPFRR